MALYVAPQRSYIGRNRWFSVTPATATHGNDEKSI